MTKVTINRKTQTFTFNCDFCGKHNEKKLTFYYTVKREKQTNFFCNVKCFGKFICKKITTKCGYCNKSIIKDQHQIKKSKSGKAFCNHSCSASYNNKLKRKFRRSKIEAKFYNLLVKEFPSLDILSNDKTMLDGYEVDISIPELKLAIEWNGIVHFKPIYGKTKLDNIQTRDAEKLKIASNKNINLIVIPDLVSNDKILKQAFNDVKNIIKKLIHNTGSSRI